MKQPPPRDKGFTPDTEEALKALVRQTIKEAGVIDPASIPHRVKKRLRDQLRGDVDIEAIVKQVLAEDRRR